MNKITINFVTMQIKIVKFLCLQMENFLEKLFSAFISQLREFNDSNLLIYLFFFFFKMRHINGIILRVAFSFSIYNLMLFCVNNAHNYFRSHFSKPLKCNDIVYKMSRQIKHGINFTLKKTHGFIYTLH